MNPLARITSLTAFAIAAHGAAFQWTAGSGGNGHWYEPVDSGASLSWSDAQAAAAGKGGYLATAVTAEENAFVFSLVDQAAYWQGDSLLSISFGPWLGGLQSGGSAEPAGGWSWLNGDGAFAYANWDTGQPDNFTAEEARLQYYVGGSATGRAATWNDAPDAPYARSYVIEYDVAPVPEAETMAMAAGVALGAFALLRRAKRG